MDIIILSRNDTHCQMIHIATRNTLKDLNPTLPDQLAWVYELFNIL